MRTRGPVARVLLRSLFGLLVVVVLWLLGLQVGAAILLAVLVVMSVTTALVPPFAAGIDRATLAFGRGVGHVVGFIGLGFVQLVIFLPASLISKLFRYDPLSRGSHPEDPSFWRPHPTRKGKPLYRREFAYDRVARTTDGAGMRGRLPLVRLRAALGLILVLVLLDIGIGSGVDKLRGTVNDDAVAQADDEAPDSFPVQDVGAKAGEPWTQVLHDEINYTWDGKQYDPYLGWVLPDFAGEHVTQTGDVRRSYEPPGSDSPDAIEVAFFGGSTLWGNSQRDEHTIPSEFARLAEADGINVRAINYGQQGWVNYQEALKLQQLVTDGKAPDLAVFYDGVNDLISQFFVGPTREPTNMQAKGLEALFGLGRPAEERAAATSEDTSSLLDDIGDWYSEHALSGQTVDLLDGLFNDQGLERSAPTEAAAPAETDEPTETDELPAGVISVWPADQADLDVATERAHAAVDLHRRGIEITEALADRFGFSNAYFWQPTFYTKNPVPGEESVGGGWGEDQNAWHTATDVSRAALEAPVIDIGDALDDVQEPVMYDFHHTNELGAKVIARAIYEQLKPQLLALSRERS